MDLDESQPALSRAAAVVDATSVSPGAAATLGEEMWRGRPLLAGVVDRLAGLAVVAVVVRDESIFDLIPSRDNITVIIDAEWPEGAASPLRAGLDYLTHSSECDMAFHVTLFAPDIDSDTLEQLIAESDLSDSPVAVPKYRYVRGGPLLLRRAIWPRLLGTEGDVDVAQLVLSHPQWVNEVRVDRAPPRRITNADDLVELAN